MKDLDSLDALREEHADLDEQIRQAGYDQLEITRLKKEKLRVKQKIWRQGGLRSDSTVAHKRPRRKPAEVAA